MFPVVYTHEFRYRFVERSSKDEPAIEVTITANGRSIDTVATVDTGAEFTAFETEYAGLLGLPTSSPPGEILRVAAIGAIGPVKLMMFPVTLEIQGEKWNTKVGFFEPTLSGSSQGKNLLGRSGFLEFLQVGFREKHQQFYLRFEA